MDSPVVQTQLGEYKGQYMHTLNGRKIAAFRGLRYAQPPINHLRFQEAVKIGAHEGIYDATHDGDDCVQDNQIYTKYTEEESKGKKFVGSEDCLFLNVFTPKVNPEKLLPVLVFIHGGAYSKGTSSFNWHGPHLLLDEDIVLVTITYRLGFFGFIVLDDNVIPSNLGMKDQALAIYWVKDHIKSFGGNPDLITVSGSSAGGVSAQLIMHSPRTKGLISRAISQSGVMTSSGAMQSRSKARETTLSIAALLNCPTDPQGMLTSLQRRTVDEIMTAVQELKARNAIFVKDTLFAPVFELKSGGFITREDILAGSNIPWMAGINHDEGFIFYREHYKIGDGNLVEAQNNFTKIMAPVFGYDGHPDQDKISEEIKQFYFGNEDISLNTLRQYINMMSDGAFINDVCKQVRNHKGKSYLYLLSHRGSKTSTIDLPEGGVSHGDELFYLYPFCKKAIKLQFNQADLRVKDIFVKMWANFATYGNPSPKKDDVHWPESEHGNHFINITTERIQSSDYMFEQRLKFWEVHVNQKYSILKGGMKP